MPTAGAEATRNAEMKYVGKERVPEQKAKVNECRRGMDVGERKLLGGMDRDVGQDSKAKQQGTSDRIPTEIRMRLIQSDTQPNSAGRTRGVQKQIRNGSESSERKETRKEQREEVATGSTRESVGGMFTKNEKPGGGPSKAPKVWSLGRCRPEGVTEVRRIRTKVESWNSSEERNRMVKQSSEVMQQICSNHIPTEIFGDIRICGGFKAVTQPTSSSNTPEVFGTKTEPRPRVPRGMCREGEGSGNGKQRRCRPKARAITQPANYSSTREMSGAEGTETECSERVFAKSCEGNRRRALKIAGGANRGLEGSTERDSRLKRSLGDARPKGDRNPEEPEEGREIWPGPGEDVWDFGKDVRDPERPESFSGASLGNRKSQNTIRTSVRVRASGDDNVGTTPERLEAEPEWNFRTDNPAKASLTGGYRVKAERQRKGSGTSRSDRINRKVRVEAQGRRRGRSGSGGQAKRNRVSPMVRNGTEGTRWFGTEPREPDGSERNRGNPMVRNGTEGTRWFGTNSRSRKVEGKNREISEIRRPKSRKRPRWKRGSAKASETRSRYRKAGDVRRQRRRPEQRTGRQLMPKGDKTESVGRVGHSPEIKGVRLSSLRLREEWKGGKEVVNDPDRSRSRGRAEDRRRPEISRVDGEVARADRSTEGQRPEVVRTEVGGRIGGEPEHSEDLGAAESADSAGSIGIGGGNAGDARQGELATQSV
ncbi:hypothetical protein DFH06DRAFT_1139031 [Mycena polygramma]|nr:hypothetical protein DFH06DRAFT_1139031 [Mycena polygramma]